MKAYAKNGSYCIACQTIDESYEAMDLIIPNLEIKMLFTDDYDFLDLETRLYSLTFMAEESIANDIFKKLGITEIIHKD